MPYQPAPSIATGLINLGRLIKRFYHVVLYGGLHDRLQGLAQRDGAPRRIERNGHRSGNGTIAVILPLLREVDGKSLALLVVCQATARVVAVGTRLRHQHPSIGSHLEQGGESISLSKSGLLLQGLVGMVFLLVRGLGALKAHHGHALGGEEGSGVLREIEGTRLVVDDGGLGVVALGAHQGIAIGHGVVRHVEDHLHGVRLGVGERHGQFLCLMRHLGHLAAAELVVHVHILFACVRQGQLLGEVSIAGVKSKG